MKFLALLATTVSLASAFVPAKMQLKSITQLHAESDTSRQDFLKALGTATFGTLFLSEPAFARGRATLEVQYQKYYPRIKAGGDFYNSDLRKLVESSDWKGIKEALADPPKRKKEDLRKPDAGVAERARQAGGFSDARVLVAADLYAASFSDNSISAKTKSMQASVNKLREVVKEMQSVAKTALGEESSGGFLGLGGKKPSEAELKKKLRELYVEGGNAWNAYVQAANDELALQFDRFPYIG